VEKILIEKQYKHIFFDKESAAIQMAASADTPNNYASYSTGLSHVTILGSVEPC
jgi:hypothetical protein